MKKERVLIIITIICGLLWCLCLFYSQFRIKKYNNDFVITDACDVLYKFEEINYSDYSVELTGWALRPSLDIEFPCVKILLKSDNDSFYIEPKTMMHQNHEISRQIDNGKDYTNAGFYTKILKVHLNNNCRYRLYLWYKPETDNLFIDTGHVIEIGSMTGEL